ncbi:phosphonate degradation HD-domain oxygenase [Floridanema evergladense]|uniref:Phosphonate degradation HD-domain oxygenase n=1 Tax=Floridaenema evergladense BLCC-F167 TaxID=3153639 RepID=A0ABV4WDB8_9CYAN
MKVKTKIVEILRSRGDRQYGGEAVSQLEHALQCATLARDCGASNELVIACLLHDFGHLVHSLGEDGLQTGLDDRHEYRVIPWLRPLYSEAVTEPIRLHVQAKRYLCAVEPSYFASLSPASQQSLILQGGIYSPEEAAAFISLPFAEDAVQLRRWDEQAKIPGQVTPSLEDFMTYAL